MNRRKLIVIGGSSGASQPLGQILATLDPELPAAVLVVLHTGSGSRGVLATVSRSAGRWTVREAEDGMAIENGVVYVAVPDYHLLIEHDHVRLGFGPRENISRPAIDPLFRSAALHHSPDVIGIVLSGHLSDGAAGLAAIKRCGGIAVVQDPGDADVDEMPCRAMDATVVDVSAPGARLGAMLNDLARKSAGPARPKPPELALEVEIAAGDTIGRSELAEFAQPVALSCPSCGGVLSKAEAELPLRFRCQVGHAFTADVLLRQQEDQVDEALRIAMRILEERAELLSRMASDGRRRQMPALAGAYEIRAAEYRKHAENIRRVVLASLANRAE